MITPEDLNPMPPGKILEPEKRRHLAQAVMLAEKSVIYQDVPKAVVPKHTTSILKQSPPRLVESIREEEESARRGSQVAN